MGMQLPRPNESAILSSAWNFFAFLPVSVDFQFKLCMQGSTILGALLYAVLWAGPDDLKFHSSVSTIDLFSNTFTGMTGSSRVEPDCHDTAARDPASNTNPTRFIPFRSDGIEVAKLEFHHNTNVFRPMLCLH